MIQIIFYPRGLTFVPMYMAKLFRFSFQLEHLCLHHCGCSELDLGYTTHCWIMQSITVPESMSTLCFSDEKWKSFKESL